MEMDFSTEQETQVPGKCYAVVTGASAGLGRCFAMELAQRGINTILIALAGTGVENVAEEARKSGTDSVAFEADLTDKSSILSVCEKINSRYRVFMLINNAGMGGTARFTECSDNYIDNIIQLNITAVALMTHRLLDNLMHCPKSYILNVSSMAAFTPIGYKTVYPASKRFILDFSRGLRQELRKNGVSISVIHPGPMKTNPDVTRRTEMQGRLGKIGLLSPETVARKGIKYMLKGQTVIIPGWMNKMNKILIDIVPARFRLPFVSNIIARELNKERI